MTQQEFKENILAGAILDDLIVLVCGADPKGKPNRSKKINYGAHYLADQYIQEIAKLKGKDIASISCLEEALPTSIDLIMGESNNLFVLRTETFSELQKDYSKFENTIIVCDKIDKKVAERLGVFTVYIPEPEGWAAQAFMNYYCPGVDPYLIEWLYSVTEGNMYRITCELDKAKLFDENQRDSILIALRDEPTSDLYAEDVYKFVEAIFMKDIASIRTMRAHLECFSLDPVGLTTLLLNKFKGILLAVGTELPAAALGMSDKQLGFFRRTYRNIDPNYFYEKIKFLSNIDLRLKQSKLDMPKDAFIDYVIAHILA